MRRLQNLKCDSCVIDPFSICQARAYRRVRTETPPFQAASENLRLKLIRTNPFHQGKFRVSTYMHCRSSEILALHLACILGSLQLDSGQPFGAGIRKGLEADVNETLSLVLQRSNLINYCRWATESTKHCAC